jgi:DNA-directed RNA polymerase sigma subunit (sigma70/sigma32)
MGSGLDFLEHGGESQEEGCIRMERMAEFAARLSEFKGLSEGNRRLVDLMMLRYDSEMTFREMGVSFGFSTQRACEMLGDGVRKFRAWYLENSRFAEDALLQ